MFRRDFFGVITALLIRHVGSPPMPIARRGVEVSAVYGDNRGVDVSFADDPAPQRIGFIADEFGNVTHGLYIASDPQ